MEPWLIRIADYLLAQSWQIAVLTIVVALATFGLRNRSAHVRYLLWLIVLAKALVPPLYSIPVAVLPQQEPATYIAAPPIAERMGAEYGVPEAAVTESSRPAAGQSQAASLPQATMRLARYDAHVWLAVGWLAGVVVLSFYYLLNALRTQIWLQRRRKTLPGEFARGIESFFAAHGVRRMPRVWLLERISQPFVWGLMRGSIYLPAKLLDGKHAKFQASLLGHELSHIVRLDAMINSLQVIAQTIFWFHPCLWWANRKIRDEREKCCDEMTIARLNTRPEEYGEAIVETLAAKYEQARPVPSLAVAGQVKNIEERIKTMLKPGKKFYKRPSLTAATIIVLTALLAVPTTVVFTARAEAQPTTKSADKSAKSLHQAAADGDIEQVKSLIAGGADVNTKDAIGETALDRAAEHGHTEVMKLLVESGADINARRPGEYTPLHIAAESGQPDAAKLLIDHGADVMARDKWDYTPLHVAGWGKDQGPGRVAVAKMLIEKGADIDARSKWHETPLLEAAAWGQLALAKLLIDKGADVNAAGTYGYRPLLYAASRGYTDMVELLLAKGADVNAKNNEGETALHSAAGQGRRNIAELLIGKGADTNVKDKEGQTPVDVAMGSNRRDVAELLVGKGADVSAFHLAAYRGDLAGLTSFLEKGDSINTKDRNGRTPLHFAASSGRKNVAEFLIAKGADVNADDRFGERPLLFAAHMGGKDVAAYLIGKGADVNAKATDGRTSLHGAAFCNQRAIAELLLANGADINAKDKGGATPLYLAAWRGYGNVVELLLDKGADVNARGALYVRDDEKDQTPLHAATRHGRVEVVKLLLNKGADVNAKDNEGRTPLARAAVEGRTEIVELLRKHGAKE